MPRTLTRLTNVIGVDLGKDQVLVKILSSRDRLPRGTDDLGPTPEVYSVLDANTIDKDNEATQQSGIRSMMLAVDRVIFDLRTRFRILTRIEACGACRDSDDHLCTVVSKQ